MLRIRIHGRGGHGVKTASRILGSALFREGYQVQDAPRYGAERRGAPIFAYVRADRQPIFERGVIDDPDLVIVVDDTLAQVAAAGVRVGLDAHSVLLLHTREDAATWRVRLGLAGHVLTLAPDARAEQEHPAAGLRAIGAGAALLGVVSESSLSLAVDDELAEHSQADRAQSRALAMAAYRAMEPHAGVVKPRTSEPLALTRAPWVELGAENTDLAAPAIHGAATSVEVRTGLWRTMRPVIDHDRCHRCHWMCALPCPDSAMVVDADGYPRVDLEHCKGCLICVAQCPFHVIRAVPEHAAEQMEARP